jgi:hypothetical protein
VIVAHRRTPLTREQVARELVRAYRQVTSALPSDGVATLLLAHTAFETGHWQKIHNHNIGNVKASPAFPKIVQLRCTEVEGGVEKVFEPPDPRCNFRAYDTPAEGAVDYVRVLRSRPHWWKGLHTESPSAFARALATPPKYFTGNPAAAERALAGLAERFRPLAGGAVRAQAWSLCSSRPRSSGELPSAPDADERRPS